METLASKLLTVPDGLLQRNFREIADHVDRVIGSGGGDGIPGNSIFFAADYATLQDAVAAAGDAGGGMVILQSGVTYNESIMMDQDFVSIWSPTKSTIIDGGEIGHAVRIFGDGCSLSGMSMKTTPGADNNYSCIYIATSVVRSFIDDIIIIESDYDGITTVGSYTYISRVFVWPCDRYGIYGGGTSKKLNIKSCAIADAIFSGTHTLWMNGDVISIIGNVVGLGSVGSIKLSSSSSYAAVGFNFCNGAIAAAGSNHVVAHNVFWAG